MKTISSQRFLDDEIVKEKIANEDFEVSVSPEFTFEGESYRVILDGHHSLAAALEAGVTPVYEESEGEMAHVLKTASLDDFLYQCFVDSPWYDVATGIEVF